MVIEFSGQVIGDYCTTTDNRWNIEIGKHRHRRVFLESAKIGMTLDDGYEMHESDHGSERLEGVLSFITQTARTGIPLKQVIEADFVCRRGLLRNLAMNGHCKTDINFYAVRRRGVIFLCEDKNLGEIPDKLRRAMYYGQKFENVMTTPPERTVLAVRKEETKTVVRASLTKPGAEPIRLYYAAQIDGLDEEGKPVELKTISKPLETGWDKSRSLAWFVTCYLANVEKIYVGERQRNRLRQFRILDSKQINALNVHPWTINGCLEKLYDILSYVKSYMIQEGLALKFKFKGGYGTADVTDFGDYIVPEHFLRVFPF